MRHHKPFRFVWTFFLCISIPSVLLLLFLHISSVQSLEENQRAIIRSNERMVVSGVERTTEQISHAVYTCIASMDYLTFCDSQTSARISRYATSLSGRLRNALTDYPEAIGFALYNSACDRMFYTSLRDMDSQIYSSLSFGPALHAGERTFDLKLLDFHGKLYITESCSQRYGTLVILLDPELNEYYRSYADSTGTAHAISFRETDPGRRERATEISEQFTHLPLELTVSDSYTVWLQPLQILILILIFLVIGLILLVGQAMHSQLIAPLGLLWNAFNRISQGETEYRIAENTRFAEINDFYRGFNQMLDVVREARSQRDQSILDAAHARLQYFQLQIRPHFYLNCLKNIRAMAAIHEDDKIQELVILMSAYLRYIFQDNRSFIPLREELEAVQGYVDLLRIMGTPIDLICDIHTDGLDDPVLPMAVLTFVENSIKHSRSRRSLTIRISSGLSLSSEGDAYQQITIRDDGAGFSPEALEELSSSDPSELRFRKYHIGIANVRHRLWLGYGTEASVTFHNEENSAVVQLRFPAKPADEAYSIWGSGTDKEE